MSPRDVGWTIIVLFVVTIVTLLASSIYKFMQKFVFHKKYSFFLSHHKGSAGLHARRIKMRLQHSTKGRVFLDVDELENLDNISFIVRSSTDNMIVLLTQEMLGRFWCAVEITGAHSNNVKMMIGHVSGELNANVIDNVHSMWSRDQVASFLELGINTEDIKAAYASLVGLHKFPLPIDASDDVLQPTLEDI